MTRPGIKASAAAGFALVAFLAASAAAAEVMPPKPARYFNDYANVVPAKTANTLNARLEQFERETSNQLVVAVFPSMQTGSSIEDYTVRIFQQWGVGQRDKDNGAILFVFLKDRKMRIEVGYGLEPVLTDAESARIIEAMKPAFKAGDFGGGLTLAVDALIAATKGEYHGSGKTVREQQGDGAAWPFVFIIVAFFILMFLNALARVRRGWVYGHDGRSRLPGDMGGWWMSSGGGGGFSGGSSSSGGGFSGGGSSFGGGFSGGGGSSGGGGASGSW